MQYQNHYEIRTQRNAKFYLLLQQIAKAWHAIDARHVIVLETKYINLQYVSIVATEHPKSLLRKRFEEVGGATTIRAARGQVAFMDPQKLTIFANAELQKLAQQTIRLTDLPSPGKYTQAWKTIKEIARREPKRKVSLEWGHYISATDAHQKLRKALHERINCRDEISRPEYWRNVENYGDQLGQIRHDRQVIAQYNRGIRYTGRNLLLHPLFKKRYPQIDNCPYED